jgi:hypothetical protein
MDISILAWLSSRDPQYRPRDDNQANMETSINVNTLLVHFVITGAEIIWYEMYYFIMCFTVELNH